MKKIITNILSLLVSLSFFSVRLALADSSPFDFPENSIEASPSEAASLFLGGNETVVDFDVSPIKPLTALVVAAEKRQKILFWTIGRKHLATSSSSIDVPADISVTAVTWHPLGNALFLLVTKEKHQEIMINPIGSWAPTTIYQSSLPLRRLVAGPRPFEVGYDEKTNNPETSYRIFFGVKHADGTYATHSITETGKREYTVLGSTATVGTWNDPEIAPKVLKAKSALPVGFHPGGHFLIWEDENRCFQKAGYQGDNWGSTSPVMGGAPICKGSVSFTPNGIGLLHWQNDQDGLTFRYDRGEKSAILAKPFRFVSTPSSVADGRGIVGITKSETGFSVQYVPVEVPLADVVNAWMFLESPQDRELLSVNSGLFRMLIHNQLYELYDTESYQCGEYDQSTPTRPYLVTTDIFWELYSAAFEGIFILSEKRVAIPNFWKFVQSANEDLKIQPQSKIAKAFAALIALKTGTDNPEADRIRKSEGTLVSSTTDEKFDFGNLKPRSHYATDPELQKYFQASKYLMAIELEPTDIATLKKLPASTIEQAQAWIDIYQPFIAPSKRPLVWNSHQAQPNYVLHGDAQEQIFPLSWGKDNEILFSTVYHDRFPSDEQIKGPGGPRVLPSALDFASVFGSSLAESILAESGEFQKYPPLKAQIANLKKRIGESKPQDTDSLYQRWLTGLSVQWSESINSPGDVIKKDLWQRKRLQTGLASWATLRHATLLVNERTQAECGEAGFERIILRPPRGYVEPDPATFEAIASLFDATIDMVKINGKNWNDGSAKESQKDAEAEVNNSDLQNGVIRRLTESRDRVRAFRDIARKEIDGKPLTNSEYEDILYVARAAEHNFLIFKSLAQKDFALSTPDPIPKVADVAMGDQSFLLAGVGAPLEWDQIVPFFGRKQIVKGVSYSFYEMTTNKIMSDSDWRNKIYDVPKSKWIEGFVSRQSLSCPAKAP